MAEQRYLAELAVLGLQARAGTEQTVLVAPPRDVEAGPEGAGAMMADTAGPAVAAAASGPDELSAGPPRPARQSSPRPATPPASTRPAWPTSSRAVAVRDDLAGAVVGDADAALQAYDAADRPGDVRRLAGRRRGLPGGRGGTPRRRWSGSAAG